MWGSTLDVLEIYLLSCPNIKMKIFYMVDLWPKCDHMSGASGARQQQSPNTQIIWNWDSNTFNMLTIYVYMFSLMSRFRKYLSLSEPHTILNAACY